MGEYKSRVSSFKEGETIGMNGEKGLEEKHELGNVVWYPKPMTGS